MKTFTQTRLPQRVLNFLDTDPARDVRGTGEQHQAHAPFSGEDLFSFPVATAGDVEKAVNYARRMLAKVTAPPSCYACTTSFRRTRSSSSTSSRQKTASPAPMPMTS